MPLASSSVSVNPSVVPWKHRLHEIIFIKKKKKSVLNFRFSGTVSFHTNFPCLSNHIVVLLSLPCLSALSLPCQLDASLEKADCVTVTVKCFTCTPMSLNPLLVCSFLLELPFSVPTLRGLGEPIPCT